MAIDRNHPALKLSKNEKRILSSHLKELLKKDPNRLTNQEDMKDKIENVLPDNSNPVTPVDLQPLPAGIHAPQNVVDQKVDYQPESVSDQVANVAIIPEEAAEELSVMSESSDDNNVIHASGTERILNLMPSQKMDEDYTLLNAIRSGVVEVKAPPPSVDLRVDWWDVSDQGNSGACVGFGTGDGLMRYLFTKNKALNPGERLAAGVLWQAAKETDDYNQYATTFIALEGTSIKAALNFGQKYGVVRESVAPFGTLYTKDAPTFYRLAAQMRLSGIYNLGKNINNWKQWLSTNGPIVAAINVDTTFENCSSSGKLDNYDVNNIYGGHCICFCGYTADNRIIIRNSWGTSWGDKGFAYASVDWIMKACLEAYGAVI